MYNFSNLIFSLINSSVPENKDFHQPSVNHDSPMLYCMLSQAGEKPLSCPPAIQLAISETEQNLKFTLIKGDSEGHITIWNVPDFSLDTIKQIDDSKKGPQCRSILSLIYSAHHKKMCYYGHFVVSSVC